MRNPQTAEMFLWLCPCCNHTRLPILLPLFFLFTIVLLLLLFLFLLLLVILIIVLICSNAPQSQFPPLHQINSHISSNRPPLHIAYHPLHKVTPCPLLLPLLYTWKRSRIRSDSLSSLLHHCHAYISILSTQGRASRKNTLFRLINALYE